MLYNLIQISTINTICKYVIYPVVFERDFVQDKQRTVNAYETLKNSLISAFCGMVVQE